MHTRKAAIAVVAVLLALGGTSAAHADPGDDLQAQVDSILAENPGGTQTGPNTIEWEDGTIEFTLEMDGYASRSIGSCATGTYCVYNGLALTGSKLAFSTCASANYSTAALPGTVRSVADAESSGYVQAKDSGGSVLATIFAGTSLSNAPAGITQVRCVP